MIMNYNHKVYDYNKKHLLHRLYFHIGSAYSNKQYPVIFHVTIKNIKGQRVIDEENSKHKH